MNINKFLWILLILSTLANLYWGLYFMPVWYPHEVEIPSQQQINNFCDSKGFDNGWLSSSSCGEDEVLCHDTIFDMEKYECLKWE